MEMFAKADNMAHQALSALVIRQLLVCC